jgi:hypothetical protein
VRRQQPEYACQFVGPRVDVGTSIISARYLGLDVRNNVDGRGGHGECHHD